MAGLIRAHVARKSVSDQYFRILHVVLTGNPRDPTPLFGRSLPRPEEIIVMQPWLIRSLVLLFVVVAAGLLYFDTRSVVKVDSEAGYRSADSGPSPGRSLAGGKSRLAVGMRYASLDELTGDQQAAGYLRTGRFGNHWPATVSAINTDNDGISFVRKDGTPHRYSGFAGYRMKVVHLRGPGDQETIVVFRSAVKR